MNTTTAHLKKSNSRRYRLHQKIKNAFRYDPGTKTIFAAYNQEIKNKWLEKLRHDYNYQIQLEIPV